jgi:trk system potassium uptake protein TrkH
MGYNEDVILNLSIASLIILGGLGFAVLSNLASILKGFFNQTFFRKIGYYNRPSLNTRIVLITSCILIFSGMLIIYALEHGNSLLRYDLGTQYIASFFQSVTLRTAGFNTIDFSTLNRFTYLLMILFMFIGGASGSTAGGIKVNTLALIGGYFHSLLKNKEDVTLYNHSISNDLINRAFFITFLYIIIIFLATLILSMTEASDVLSILFEVVSAIGTVGLSTGITQNLTTGGKLAVVILMFIGRVGPLTVVVSLAQRKKSRPITYPQGNIIIG